MYIVCVSLGIYGQWRGDPARAVLFTLLAVAACFGPAVVLSGKDIEFLNHSLYTMQRFQAAKLAVLYVIVLLLLVGYRAPLMGYLLATAAMVCLYIFVVFAVAGLYAIA